MFDLSGKVAVVTGASKGLGKVIAKTLAKANAQVVVTSRNKELLEKVVQEIVADGNQAIAIPSDIQDISSIQSLFNEAKAQFGKVDILINNAGTSFAKSALEITEEEWKNVLDTNLTGLFFSCQSAGQLMVEQGRGKIVNIASVMGVVGDVFISPYVASKGGVVQLTKALALEWARHKINVNAVGPGYVKTDMTIEALEENEKFHSHVMEKTPLRRFGEPEEIAAAVLYLSSDEADYVTGHTLFVDGGWVSQ
ncbi:SDR family NAD(P)-dependent oxidoreductase [Oceanobacillus sp. CF4.6]|uniref:SDR family NAD(P)-dependent oxidoreductase n=1 Tax=Oceanobacillus sp. CF4.6 TaxID=3373080 RepID=UPI003EE69CE0